MKCTFPGRDTDSITTPNKERPIPISAPTAKISNPKIGYTSLPGEVRNKIMALVLCPGIIYLRAKPTQQNNFTSYSNDPHLARDGSPLPPPGIQLLATCRQVYNEGRIMYYAGNVFDLPPGPVAVTRELFAKVKLENLALMRHFRIQLSLLDLTRPVLEQLQKDYKDNPYPKKGPFSWITQMPHNPGYHRDNSIYTKGRKFEIEAKRILTALWEAKISYLSAKFPGIQSLQISTIRRPKEGGATTYVLEKEYAVVIIGSSVVLSTTKLCLSQPGSWKHPLYRSMPEVGKLICRKVRNMGWERLRDCITTQAVLAFERDLQKVSKTDVAYLANRFRPHYHVFPGEFVKELPVEVDEDRLEAAHGGCPLSLNHDFEGSNEHSS